MPDSLRFPPDAGTTYRALVDKWDDLWHGRYRYPQHNPTGRTANADRVDAAPGYTRSFSRLVSGLFLRQPPMFVEAPDDESTWPLDELELSNLLVEVAAKGAGFGQVLLRPVSDGQRWSPSVVTPDRYTVDWVHRRPVRVTVWDHSRDPRDPDNDRRGLAFIEVWEPSMVGPGTVVTSVFETTTTATGGEMEAEPIDVSNPPAELAEHPYITSAGNDTTARDMFVFVWAWEDCGPVSLWYTNEGVIEGLARLWDQEQDDAEMTRRRVAMPKDLVGTAQVLADGTQTVLARPGFNKHDNILLLSSSMSAEHGPNGGVTPIEFADDLIQRDRIERRENALLEAVGINPASIGRNVGGRSDSASAKRADNQMTMNTITGPARQIEQVLSAAASEIARLRNRIGRTVWDVSVSEGLKENPVESAETARMLRDADAASTETLVRTAHPTWTSAEVDAEVERMQAEGSALAPIE